MRAVGVFLASFLAAACAAAAHPATPAAHPGAPAEPTACGSRAPELDEAEIVERSHAYFEVLDKADVGAFEAMLAPSFMTSGPMGIGERSTIVRDLEQRISQHEPPRARTRTWSDERVYRSGTMATFAASTVERVRSAGRDVERSGRVILVWSREAERLQLVLHVWDPTGLVSK